MPRTAKLFRHGRSQAVRSRQDPATGDVILSRRPESWESFFQLTEQGGVPEDFMADRFDQAPQKRGSRRLD